MRCQAGILLIALFNMAHSAPSAEDLVSFDPITVTIRWEKNSCLLKAGERVLKDFGTHQHEAWQALRLIQAMKLTQYGTVGSPSPVLEYWLCDGKAPEGFAPDLRRLPMDAATLRIECVQTQWCLRDERTIFFNFAFQREQAQQALDMIRKYGFTEIGVLGGAQPDMLVFLAAVPRAVPLAVPKIELNSIKRPSLEQNPANPPAKTSPDTIVTPALPPLRDPLAQGIRLPLVNGSPPPGWESCMECVPFNWRQVRMHDEAGDWQLLCGNRVLASFGEDDDAARQALSVLGYYRFTEQFRIGKPRTLFSFFLINGEAPRGLMFGLSGQAFQPQQLAVQQLGQNWALCEGDRVLVLLGEKAAEAHQLLDLIRQHKFDRLCKIGGLTLLVRSR